MTDRRRATGRRGEALAAGHLVELGMRVCETNWRCPIGEVDIVARDGDWLVLVEVRTRRGTRFGRPEESIGRVKQDKLVALGQYYAQVTGWPGPWRIDVVAVELGPDDAAGRVTHYPNAVAPRGG